jgi:CDGSH-type Zn-finger protein/uncharacterized Fe-S cluster protein YjdI
VGQEGDDMGRRKRYETEGMIVTFEPKRCIHAAECVRGLPRVFAPGRRPWVDADAAANDEIESVVERCPTGALRYERADGSSEAVPESNAVRVRPRGPLYVRGDLELRLADGETIRDTRLALCRCGASSTKPFCDNSHRNIGFDDSGSLGEERQFAGEIESTTLAITLVSDGPLLLNGPVEIVGTTGTTRAGGDVALCRCGASQAKPYCDGSHRTVDFDSGSRPNGDEDG